MTHWERSNRGYPWRMRLSRVDEPVSNSGLDPVVQAAMANLTSWVYPPLRERMRRRFYGHGRWERNLKNPSNRAAVIHTCKHLKYQGYDFPPEQLRDWALAHGWSDEDADALSRLCDGRTTGDSLPPVA